MRKVFVRKLFREPLIIFLVMMVIMFVFEWVRLNNQKAVIHVSDATISYLVSQREQTLMRQLNENERNKLVEDYIRDEVLFREAVARGLAESDSRVKRMLIDKLRYYIVGDLALPDDDTLKDWYLSNQDMFTKEESRSLEQIYFSDMGSVPLDFLEQLQQNHSNLDLTNTKQRIPRQLHALSREDIVTIFGVPATKTILNQHQGHWFGPVKSAHGVHFIRIFEHYPSELIPLQQVKGYAQERWKHSQARDIVDQELVDVWKNYEIRIETE